MKGMRKVLEVQREEDRRRSNSRWEQRDKLYQQATNVLQQLLQKFEPKELERKHEAGRNPFQMNQVSVCSIPSVPVQKVTPLQVARKTTSLKVHFKTPKFPLTNLSPFEPK